VIDAWYDTLGEKLNSIPRRFVFNVVETGSSEHADTHEVRVVVSIASPDPSVPVPIDRHSKRSTLVACIAANGYRMKPFLIVDLATVDSKCRSTATIPRTCSSPLSQSLHNDPLIPTVGKRGVLPSDLGASDPVRLRGDCPAPVGCPIGS
jgi:hypothetical protein